MKKICENCKYCQNGKYTDLCYFGDGGEMNKDNNCKNYEKKQINAWIEWFKWKAKRKKEMRQRIRNVIKFLDKNQLL